MEPAFPVALDGSNGERVTHIGMMLRDYFAAKAMVGLLRDKEKQKYWTTEYGSEESVKLTAQRAYEYADAMLKARGGA